jgi:CHAT domain-containing protein
MPFGALRHNNSYLIEKSSIFYLPNASLLSLLLKQPTDSSQKVLVFADPDGTLEYSRLEASSIHSVFPNGAARSFVGSEANKGSFNSHYQDYSIIHFATHGSFNPKYPIFSALLLSDGELILADVSRMRDFNADMVVLSACNTGANRIVSGDELIGLSGVFIRAGASAVLVNLWKAEDDTTPILIERFYRRLIRDDMPKDLALQEAKRSMVADGYNPISWGGFVLIGNID